MKKVALETSHAKNKSIPIRKT